MKEKKISIKAIMILSYTAIILLMLVIYSLRSLAISEKAVTGIAHENMQKLIEAKNEILDMSFNGIREASLNLLVDEELFHIFSGLNWRDPVALGEANDDIKNILQKYFYSYQQITSVFLVTDLFTFGYGDKDIIYGEEFFDTDAYHHTEALEGAVLFTPMPKGYLAMMRVANLTVIEDSGRIKGLQSTQHTPVLVIGFKEQVFRDEIFGLLPPEEADYRVLTPDGMMVSHSDRTKVGTYEDREDREYRDQKGSANEFESSRIVCQTASGITGWQTVVTMSKSMLMKDVMSDIRKNLILFLIISAFLGALISYAITYRITGSIGQLTGVVKRMGKGDFDGTVEESGIEEFDYLIKSFNDMGVKLKHLIEENLMIKIRQQESEIAILNTQLNPHFLQNTLNMIQFSNLNSNPGETGKMIVALSRMLHYTMDNKEEMKRLSDDMEWLKQYIFIMNCRYGNEFEINCSIESELMVRLVPKLFLQPILENSIFHAFKDKDYGGIINITGKQTGDRMVFTIEDNGDGMDEAQIGSFFEESGGSIGIKNVYARLQLIYKRDDLFEMESRLGEGTKTIISIPLSDD